MADQYIHETAVIDPGAQTGAGTRIWHFCHVMPVAVIGNNCIPGQNVFVDNNTSFGNGVKVQNNVSIYNGVTLDLYMSPGLYNTNVCVWLLK